MSDSADFDPKWVVEVVEDALRSSRLTPWEVRFIESMKERLDEWGDDIRLTDNQVETLQKIERKIYA